MHNFIATSGMLQSPDQLRAADLEQVLESLVYDAKLTMTTPSIHGDERLYRVMPRLASIDGLVRTFTCVPACECLTCMGIEQPDRRYVPCPNMSAWLDAAAGTEHADGRGGEGRGGGGEGRGGGRPL